MEKMTIKQRRRERGYTLLEYCAGAAVIAGVVWGAMAGLGGNMTNFLNGISGWVAGRTAEINNNNAGGQQGGAAQN